MNEPQKINPNEYRVMVVDDDIMLLEELKPVFEDEGYGVVIASSGMAALECLAKGHIDLVLSDIHMPEGDGQFLLRSVRAEDPAIPFFIMTGFNDFSAEEALKRGCTAFFKKPLDIEAVLLEVETALFEVYGPRGRFTASQAGGSTVAAPSFLGGYSPNTLDPVQLSAAASSVQATIEANDLETQVVELARENERLRRAVADLTLEKMALQDLLAE